MKKLFSSFAFLAALIAAAVWAPAEARADYAQQPRGYVSPQERIKAVAGAPDVAAAVAQAQPKLPAGVPANSLAAQQIREKWDAEEAIGCKVHKSCVPAIGRSADGKYPVYQLEGELEDLNYISTRSNTVFQPEDLLRRLVFLADADAKGGAYSCGFICKDNRGRVVGLNPKTKWMLDGAKQAKKK